MHSDLFQYCPASGMQNDDWAAGNLPNITKKDWNMTIEIINYSNILKI